MKYHSVTVITAEQGRTFECRANEMEQDGANSCMVSALRSAPVRIILRDGATFRQLHEALKALKAFMGKTADGLPTGGGSGGYVP